MFLTLKKFGTSNLLNVMALSLMAASLASAYARVLASDSIEQSELTARLVRNAARKAGADFVPPNSMRRVSRSESTSCGEPAEDTLLTVPLLLADAKATQNKTGAATKAGGSAPAPETHPAALPQYQRFKLVDENGKPIYPNSIAQVDAHMFMLGTDCLYLLADIAGSNQQEHLLHAQTIPVPQNKIKGIQLQEFLSFCYWPLHKSLAVLDKSGSLFEYDPHSKKWNLLWANRQTLGSPDPHYVAITSDGPHLLLLDPERNQIWRFPLGQKNSRYFREVLPWRIHAGDPNVADGIGIGFDGSTEVLRRSGVISVYPSNVVNAGGISKHLNYKMPGGIQPSRFAIAAHSPAYIIERENCRVLAIEKSNGAVKQYYFPNDADLRGLMPGNGGFGVIDGDGLDFRMNNEPAPAHQALPVRKLDSRLRILRLPVKGNLPGHPGVFPGARRLYRHGIHQGLDFFHDPGAGTHVAVNTPAFAAAAGKVIRADVNYHDMDAKQYNKIMSECAASQYCSPANEDLFRGCQVWLDHGNGLVTVYAHLNKARPDLKVGMPIDAGETVGYIGYSGTGENQGGRVKHPHLHFEVHLDGHYLGYGLTPAETISLYRKLFAKKRGH